MGGLKIEGPLYLGIHVLSLLPANRLLPAQHIHSHVQLHILKRLSCTLNGPMYPTVTVTTQSCVVSACTLLTSEQTQTILPPYLALFPVLFLLIGISVFGAKTSIPEFGSGGLNYSFGLAVIALLVTVAVCVLTVLQLRFSRML